MVQFVKSPVDKQILFPPVSPDQPPGPIFEIKRLSLSASEAGPKPSEERASVDIRAMRSKPRPNLKDGELFLVGIGDLFINPVDLKSTLNKETSWEGISYFLLYGIDLVLEELLDAVLHQEEDGPGDKCLRVTVNRSRKEMVHWRAKCVVGWAYSVICRRRWTMPKRGSTNALNPISENLVVF
jgi:hypothetical protein